MIGIFRRSIEGASVAGGATATAVQAAFFTALSVLMVICVAIFRPHTVSKGSPADEGGGFVASHPFLVPLVIVVVIVALIVFWPRLKPRLADTWHKAKAGAAIFRDWRRYLREVALPSAASYACRIGVNVVFMAAFGIPITAYTVFLIASSHMLSGLFAITPGGVGQTQALDIATLRGRAPTGSVAAFSITQDSVMTIWNVVLGIVVMTWAFGFDSMKHMLSRRGREEARASPQACTGIESDPRLPRVVSILRVGDRARTTAPASRRHAPRRRPRGALRPRARGALGPLGGLPLAVDTRGVDLAVHRQRHVHAPPAHHLPG